MAADSVVVSRIPIRWGDMDAMGHVYNTIYFRYFEQARCEWLESIGVGANKDETIAPVLINASCDFLLPLTVPGVAVVEMRFGKVGRSSVETFYRLSKEGPDSTGPDGSTLLYAQGAAKLVWIDVSANKSVELPAHIRDLFAEKA